VLCLKTDGTMWAWGEQQTVSWAMERPLYNLALSKWELLQHGQCFCGRRNVPAVKTDGTIGSWGAGSDGALGQDDTLNKSSPVQVGALTDWLHSCSTGAGATTSCCKN
jgi:alpha-tubulin suppressor-like RCC1 family protein